MVDVETTFGRCYLPSGRWNSHMLQQMAGVICQVADVIATIGSGCVVNDMLAGRWNSHGSVYFNLSSEVLNRTSSHMCGRWNLPLFLFRDGLLTLMNSASFIALLTFWSSLPNILKFSILMLWPVLLVWSNIGEGAFLCSLNLSPNTHEDSPMYSSSESTLLHLYL